MQKEPNNLKIIKVGHSGLKTIAKPVDNPQSKEVHDFIRDLIAMAIESGNSVGLAATQVNTPWRIFIFREDLHESFTVAINPEIEFLSDEHEYDWEACMSVPDLMGLIKRFTHIKLTYINHEGQKTAIILKDYAARVVQHEYDHLDGILFIDRVEDETKLSKIKDY